MDVRDPLEAAIGGEPLSVGCPGCGIGLPATPVEYSGYYNTSSSCWDLFTEVQGVQYSNVLLARHAHQITVDAYAVQHAGGRHPPKSVAIHLSGLYLVLETNMDPLLVAPTQQRLARTVERWPHFDPAPASHRLTVFDVAMAGKDNHVETVRSWAGAVWSDWIEHHGTVAGLIDDSEVI